MSRKTPTIARSLARRGVDLAAPVGAHPSRLPVWPNDAEVELERLLTLDGPLEESAELCAVVGMIGLDGALERRSERARVSPVDPVDLGRPVHLVSPGLDTPVADLGELLGELEQVGAPLAGEQRLGELGHVGHARDDAEHHAVADVGRVRDDRVARLAREVDDVALEALSLPAQRPLEVGEVLRVGLVADHVA